MDQIINTHINIRCRVLSKGQTFPECPNHAGVATKPFKPNAKFSFDRLAISRLLCRSNSISDGVSCLGVGEVASF